MKQLKKSSVGYNTVSSMNGVISARGVKSYPKNLEIFGYTQELGEGEKSPDNPYTLISLDSGAMSVDGVDYEHSIVLSNNDTTIQVPVPIALNRIDGVSDYIYKDTDGIWKLKQLFMTFDSAKYLDSLKLTSTSSTSSTYQIVYKDSNPLTVKEYCVSTYYKSNMFSLVNFEESRDNIAKFFRNNDYFSLYLRYSSEDYPQFSDIDTLRAWLVDNPIKIVYNSNMIKEHILSDYAQDLLNSFMIQNQNEIFVEGYPDLKVSGYIQK